MKKHYVFALAFAATLSLGACSSDNDLDHGFDGNSELVEADGQVLSLCVDNGGDGRFTRAGRPLLSSAAKQDIDYIVLYVVNEDSKVILKKVISKTQWDSASPYENGKQIQITFRKSEGTQLIDGKYQMYAIGYKQSDSNYKLSEFETVGNTVNNTSKVDFSHLFATLSEPATNKAEEIFAGVANVTAKTTDGKSYLVKTDAEGTAATSKKVPTLILNRQVAGVTGYFSNLPAKVGEQNPAKLRLVASGKSDKVFFTTLLGEETDKDNAKAQSNVINGVNQACGEADTPYFDQAKKGYVLYEIDLKTFFPLIGEPKPEAQRGGNFTFADLDLDKDGYVGYKDAQFYVYGKAPSIEDLKNWSMAIQGEYPGTNKLADFWKNPKKNQTLVAGSIFAGEFVIPFGLTAGTKTFELQLISDKGDILKTWNVGVDALCEAPRFADGVSQTAATKDGDLVYNIYRNHMYSMGVKANDTDEPTNPNPDPKPNPDPDPVGPTDPKPEEKPEDLSKGQDLLINVNDNWEIIHGMIID